MVTATQLLQTLLDGLTPREREVLVGRFGLEKSRKRETLASLGNAYGVTRERIRQIESSALRTVKKNIAANAELMGILEKAKKNLKDHGGVMLGTDFIDFFASFVPGITERHCALIIESAKPFFAYAEDREFRSFYYLDKKQLKNFVAFIAQWIAYLNERKAQTLSGSYESFLAEFAKKKGISLSQIRIYLAVSKEVETNPYGDVGLSRWPEIKPKTIRDRVYLVLKKRGEPLHFKTIARTINEIRFDAKKASAPTVHNELIKDNRFVLVGRGMYALSEHGYQSGTAKEVIHRILGKSGPLTARQVILAVQKERFFKPNTVLVNLQNKAFFARRDDGTYHVREA